VKARLFTDGGARGNPGPAAYGYVLEAEDGTVLAAEGAVIGTATNNVAEYSGLVAGLRRALELHVSEVELVSDSELMVKQMRGEYRVKNDALRGLFLEATALARRLQSVDYRHVKRAHNELADRLVNEALDAAGERLEQRGGRLVIPPEGASIDDDRVRSLRDADRRRRSTD
jgi:ribonuclease HI